MPARIARRATPTARCSCPSRSSASSRLRTASTAVGVASAHDRTAGPDHPRSECQRLRAGLGRRAAVGAARRLSAARHAGEEGRRARLCHAADAGDRRLRHAPAAGRARPADLHRRSAGVTRYETLAPSGAVSRVQLEEAQARAGRPEGPPRRARQDPPRAGGADRAGGRRGRRRHAGRRPDRAAQRRGLPDRRSGAAVGRGAELRSGGGLGRGLRDRRQRPARCTLAFRGSGLADRNQSIPVHFAIEGDTGGLRAGQFVTVLATRPASRRRASRSRAAAWCAAPTARTSSTSTPARSGSSRARCASSRSTASACWWSRGSSPASASSCRAPSSSTTCARSGDVHLPRHPIAAQPPAGAGAERSCWWCSARSASRGCRSTCFPT